MIFMSNIYTALKAIVMKNGKILILKRSGKEDCFKDQWDLPGGGMDDRPEEEEDNGEDEEEEDDLIGLGIF